MYDQLNKVTPSTVSSQLLASGDPSGTWASAKGHAVWIRPSSPLIGKTIDSLTWTLKNANGTTGTLDFGVWGTYGNTTPVQSFGSISESTLTTSFADYTLTFTPYTIQEGDYIGFRTSSDGINSMVTASASLPSLYTDYHASTWWNNGLSGAYGWDTYPITGGGNLSSSTNTHSVEFGIQGRLMGQRFVETFSGDAPDVDRWGFGNQDGATGNLASMADEVDGGIKLLTGSGTNQALTMSFLSGTSLTGSDHGYGASPLRQYSPTGSVMISVWKQSADSGYTAGGLSNLVNGDVTAASTATSWGGDIVGTYFKLRTIDASGGQNDTPTTVLNDTNFHTHKIECRASGVDLSIDGTTNVTNTTQLPTAKLAPVFTVNRPIETMNITYCEVYNT